MSSEQNDSFPTVGLKVSNGSKHLAEKTYEAWKYIHANHVDSADYFIKTDDDTFVVVENLKRYLYGRNPNEAEFFGHSLTRSYEGLNFTYSAGGPGEVLSGQALRILVEKCYLSEKDTGYLRKGRGRKCLFVICYLVLHELNMTGFAYRLDNHLNQD